MPIVEIILRNSYAVSGNVSPELATALQQGSLSQGIMEELMIFIACQYLECRYVTFNGILHGIPIYRLG